MDLTNYWKRFNIDDIRALLAGLDVETVRTLLAFVAQARRSGAPKDYILNAMELKLHQPEKVKVVVVECVPNTPIVKDI